MIARWQGYFPITLMCLLLGVSRSKFYAWRAHDRDRSRSSDKNWLLVLIRSVHRESGGILGYRRMHKVLQQQLGETLSLWRVRRCMQRAGLAGIPKRKPRSKRPRVGKSMVPDLVGRNFTATAPNVKWVTDITEFKTGEGKVYLCVIKDLYQGLVVGWGMSARATAEFVVDTVLLTLEKTQRPRSQPTILHSDHGSQYTSKAYRECLQRHGLQISMGRVRTCADNASAESVFAQLKRELVHQCRFPTRQEAKHKVNEYFTKIYNPLRRLVDQSAKSQLSNITEQRVYCAVNGENSDLKSVP